MYSLTARQRKAHRVLCSKKPHILLYGGSRSGKTFLILRNLVYRALKAGQSKHCILRRNFTSTRRAIINETFPKVIENCFPALWDRSTGINKRLNRSEWIFRLPNDSEVWFGGLEDKERTEKILGNEYSTIFYNECSEMRFDSVQMVWSRLAEKRGLTNRFFYDCNPPTVNHWTYPFFFKNQNPESREELAKKMTVAFQMNPIHNRENLPEGYIDTTLASMSMRQRKRFLDGRYGEDDDRALWKRVWIHRARMNIRPLQFEKLCLGVDPAITSNVGSDLTGMVLAGTVKMDNVTHAVVLDDYSFRGTPMEWGNMVRDVFRLYGVNEVIAEVNQGGDMVESNIKTVSKEIPVIKTWSSQGKFLRAEPVSALYEQGLIHHIGSFPELEDEMCSWTPEEGNSPNRMDALVIVLSHLMGITRRKQKMGGVW